MFGKTTFAISLLAALGLLAFPAPTIVQEAAALPLEASTHPYDDRPCQAPVGAGYAGYTYDSGTFVFCSYDSFAYPPSPSSPRAIAANIGSGVVTISAADPAHSWTSVDGWCMTAAPFASPNGVTITSTDVTGAMSSTRCKSDYGSGSTFHVRGTGLPAKTLSLHDTSNYWAFDHLVFNGRGLSPVCAPVAQVCVDPSSPADCPCPPPCNESLVSGTNTTWTHYISGASVPGNVEGTNVSAVIQTPSSWGSGISALPGHAAPEFIWKQSKASYTGGATRLPVMFERYFTTCLIIPEVGRTLSVRSDNAFEVVFNGQLLTPICGTLYHSVSPHSNCHGLTTSYALPALRAYPATNGLVFYVWDHGSPGMLQYRLDY